MVWKPPIDPVTGAAQWDGAFGSSDAPEEGVPEVTAGRRSRAKARAEAKAQKKASRDSGAGEGTALDVSAILGAAPVGDETAPVAKAGSASATAAPVVATAAPLVATPVDESDGGAPPGAPGEESGLEPDGQPEGQPRTRNTRTVLVLLVVLILVIGGIVYFATKPKTTNATATTAGPTPSSSPVAADTALATSINLRLSDLPAGWSASSIAGQVSRPPVTPAAAQVQANRQMASCVGVDYSTAAGLFGGSVLPGQTDSVRSPRFQSGTNPNIQMYSTTTILSTPAQAQALTVPFGSPNFATCFGAYQTALVSAAVPGATAQIVEVSLAAPTGVKAFGYLTALTIPNQANQVIGEAFMVGGRIETRLEPTTDGPAIPSAAFNPAFDAVVGRIAAAHNN